MEIRQISDQISVSSQVAAAHLVALHDLGFRSIICNRPDGEDADQLSFQEIATAAEKVGIMAAHIPVAGGVISDEKVAVFGAALDELPKPILAYCRTGTRSAMLWSLAKAATLPLSAILSVTQRAGYDMTSLEPRIDALQKSPKKNWVY